MHHLSLDILSLLFFPSIILTPHRFVRTHPSTQLKREREIESKRLVAIAISLQRLFPLAITYVSLVTRPALPEGDPSTSITITFDPRTPRRHPTPHNLCPFPIPRGSADSRLDTALQLSPGHPRLSPRTLRLSERLEWGCEPPRCRLDSNRSPRRQLVSATVEPRSGLERPEGRLD